MTSTSQVIVVGAGPTGLMLACELKLMGVDVVVIDRRAHGTAGESRAPGINARSMEVFGQRGLAERFLACGKPLPFVLFSGIPMMPGKEEPGWPNALILPQHETERLLAERAGELGLPILWSTDFVHLVQDDKNVEVFVSDGHSAKRLHAQYVVGCDGGHSAVRSAAGISFEGDDPLSHWVVADAILDNPPGEHQRFGRNTRVGTYQVSSTEPGWFRVTLAKMRPPVDRNAPVTLEELHQAMLEGIGTDFGLREARWMSRFGDGFRQAGHYRQGRVFLAGDAAHTHSPIGGQGLNLGVQDGVNLGWKLAAVLLNEAPESLLDTYHDERHPVAENVLQLSRAQTAMIKPGRQIDALREVVASMLDLPEISLRYCGILSGLDLRYHWGEGAHPLVGRRMPNLPLAGDPAVPDVFTLMHAGRPLLLNFLGDGSISLPERWRTRVDYINTRTQLGKDDNWRLPVVGPIPNPSAVFVRPDGYVAWVGEQDRDSRDPLLLEALEKWL